jgi:hypothetical protein
MAGSLEDLIAKQTQLLEKYDYAFFLLEKKSGDFSEQLKLATEDSIKLLKAEIVDLDVEATITALRAESTKLQGEMRQTASEIDIESILASMDEKITTATTQLEQEIANMDVDAILLQIKTDTDSAIALIKAQTYKVMMVDFQHSLPTRLESETSYKFSIVGGNPLATYKLNTQSIFTVSKITNIKAGDEITIRTPLVEDVVMNYEIAIIEVVGAVETSKIVNLEVGHINKNGQTLFETVGTNSFIVPSGVTSICAVAVGGGGGGTTTWSNNAGSGGALAYANNIPVSAGEVITVIVGNGGAGHTSSPNEGQNTFLKRANGTILFTAEGGKNSSAVAKPISGSVVCYGGQGGIGGINGSKSYGGGGGAGGYGFTTDGSDAKGGNGSYGTKATAGVNGGGGGGGGYDSSTYAFGGGGGVGLKGIGTSGQGGDLNNGNSFYSDGRYRGKGGSGGDDGADNTNGSQNINGRTYYHGCGGRFGGGGAGSGTSVSSNSNFCAGGQGGVRIIWGAGRSFPHNAQDVSIGV